MGTYVPETTTNDGMISFVFLSGFSASYTRSGGKLYPHISYWVSWPVLGQKKVGWYPFTPCCFSWPVTGGPNFPMGTNVPGTTTKAGVIYFDLLSCSWANHKKIIKTWQRFLPFFHFIKNYVLARFFILKPNFALLFIFPFALLPHFPQLSAFLEIFPTLQQWCVWEYIVTFWFHNVWLSYNKTNN